VDEIKLMIVIHIKYNTLPFFFEFITYLMLEITYPTSITKI